MRDSVVATGLEFEELSEDDAAELGCVSALQRRQRKGRLSRQEYLCYAAASGGNLKELKALRENDCLWDELTCAYAASAGHLDILQWLRANGCPWNRVMVFPDGTIQHPANGYHLLCGGVARAPRSTAVGAREWMPVERVDVQVRGEGQAPGSAAVGTREGMPMGRVDV